VVPRDEKGNGGTPTLGAAVLAGVSAAPGAPAGTAYAAGADALMLAWDLSADDEAA
jgi:hypothetical protein